MIISACAHKNVNSDEVCIAKKLKIWIQVEECLKYQNPSTDKLNSITPFCPLFCSTGHNVNMCEFIENTSKT